MSDLFYIGYEAQAPRRVVRWIRRTVLGLVAMIVLVAVALVTEQSPFAASRFEYGVTRSYSGEIVEWPHPILVVGDQAYLLVAPGKFGAADLVQSKEGRSVQLRGSLIERDGIRMLQVEPASMRFGGVSQRRSSRIDLGPATFRGEIVDTKCFLGVMNPGQGKVHRDCAVRCISGGIPPGFLVRDGADSSQILLLVGRDGRAIGREILEWVAEPITISGNLVRTESGLVLEAEPRDFRQEY